MQLHVVCADRPGLLGLPLDRLGHELAAAIGVDRASIDPAVLYAHTNVADGRLAVSRVMVRLASPELTARLESGGFDEVERVLRRSMLNAALATNLDRSGPAPWWDAQAVVSLRGR